MHHKKPKLKRLRKIRREAGISQSEMADYLGISTQAYHMKESGKSSLKLEEAKKIADILESDIEKLFFSRFYNKIEDIELNISKAGKMAEQAKAAAGDEHGHV